MRSFPRGQSLIEIVIAIGLLVLTLGAAASLLTHQLSSLNISRNTSRAINLAEEGLEASRMIRDRDWNLLSSGAHGLVFSNSAWSFQGTSDTTNGFSRTITITDLSATERQLTSTITWVDQGNRTRSISFNTTFSNWRAIGGTLLHGDWLHPQTLGSVDLGPGNSGTDLAVNSKIIYMTAIAASGSKDDFYIIDATDGSQPFINGSLNTGPGLNKVAVAGNYAYVANHSNTNQLQIINVSDPASPTLISSTTLNNEKGLSVAVAGNYAYVGTKINSNKEFYIIDVSNPASPIIKGSLEINDDVNDLFVYKNHVYLATSKDTQEFIVVDPTDPANPTQVAAINPNGTLNGLGLYINSQNDHASLTRQYGGAGSPDLTVIDVSNPAVPATLGSYNVSGDVNAVVTADNLAFLGTSYSNMEFQIFDISNPSLIYFYSGLNFPQMATSLALEDNIVYVSVRSNDALRIITSQ